MDDGKDWDFLLFLAFSSFAAFLEKRLLYLPFQPADNFVFARGIT
jgi:hypothetical protein